MGTLGQVDEAALSWEGPAEAPGACLLGNARVWSVPRCAELLCVFTSIAQL